MNRSIFMRLFWKEYRQQRALWLCAAAVNAAGMFLAFNTLPDNDKNARSLAYYFIAIFLTGFYALGCCATLFAAEREAGTDAFLQSLPLSYRQLLAGKIGCASICVSAMLCLTCTLAGWKTEWRAIREDNLVELFAYHGSLIIDLSLGAIFFSLYMKRPLVVAVLGGLAAMLGRNLLDFMLLVCYRRNGEEMIHIFLYYHIIYELVTIVLIWRLGTMWLQGRGQRGRSPFSRRSGIALWRSGSRPQAKDRPARGDDRFAPNRVRLFGRLLWQHWRLSRKMLMIFVSLTIPLSFILIQNWINGYLGYLLFGLAPSERLTNMEAVSLPINGMAFLALGLVPLMGIAVFYADNRDSARFISEHSASPRIFWLSRQVSVWGAGVLALSIFYCALVILLFLNKTSFYTPETIRPLLSQLHDRQSENSLEQMNLEPVLLFINGPVIIVIMGLSAGQFCSMLFRSGIIAGFFSFILTCIFVCWLATMNYLGVPWLWSVATVPLLLLLATWLRVPYWLLERNGPRTWLKPAISLVVPSLLILAGIAYFRMTEIPLVNPGFSIKDIDADASPEQQTALKLFQEAWRLMVKDIATSDKSIASPANSEITTDYPKFYQQMDVLVTNPQALKLEEIAQVYANRESIALTLKASNVSFHTCPNSRIENDCGYIPALCHLLINSARQMEEQGDLDAAVERYLAAIKIAEQFRRIAPREISASSHLEHRVCYQLPLWAARPNQTPERIAAALRQLERLTGYLDAGKRSITSHYIDVLATINGDEDMFNTTMATWTDELRMRHELSNLWLLLPWERSRAVRLLNIVVKTEMVNACQMEEEGRVNRRITNTSELTSIPPKFFNILARERGLLTPLDFMYFHYYFFHESRAYKETITLRRATHLLLALQAWKLQNGSLPDSLQDLVGPYLDRMPNDPYTGKPFHYLQNGFERAAHWSENGGEKILPPRLPLIYSDDAIFDFNTDPDDLPYNFDEYISPWQYRHVGAPISQPEEWRSSFVFPIP
jgi:ABC-type transport system involved in multi-copper enzyme maturation permease subunit